MRHQGTEDGGQRTEVLSRIFRVLDMACRAAAQSNLIPDSCPLAPVPRGTP